MALKALQGLHSMEGERQVLLADVVSYVEGGDDQHHHDQVVTTTEDPSKLYNTSMCGTANNRVINGQPVRREIHQQYFHHTANFGGLSWSNYQ